ncbi:MAG: hypothetical protein AAFQ94_19620 [Bacteroidota bacterium]
MLQNLSNIKNAKNLNKAEQEKINGGLLQVIPNQCYGSVSFSPDGTCGPGERLIGHCICCADKYA